MIKRMDWDDVPEVACKMKCTDEQPGEPVKPELVIPEAPEEPEKTEEIAIEPAFPDKKWWLDYNDTAKSAETVITFEEGTSFTLEGKLVEEWGTDSGLVLGDNKSDPKTFTLT